MLYYIKGHFLDTYISVYVQSETLPAIELIFRLTNNVKRKSINARRNVYYSKIKIGLKTKPNFCFIHHIKLQLWSSISSKIVMIIIQIYVNKRNQLNTNSF